MPNQTRQAYGDIFSVQTPYLDQLSNRIYSDEKQREVYKQQQDKALDDEFARNLTGIRDVDINKLTQAYGDFKQARMATLNKTNVPPEQQLDVLRKKAAIYDVIDKSKTQREREKDLGKQIMTNKNGMFADDAHQTLSKIMNTPVDKVNPDDENKLMYPYAVPKLDKQIKDAQGKPAPVEVPLGQSKTDPLKDDKKVYSVGNAPDKFANKLLEGVMATNEGRNFTGLMNNKYNDAQYEDLKNRYSAKVNDPEFISVFGQPKPLPAPDTQLGKAVGIRTMEEYANMNLEPKTVSTINDARATASRQQFAKDQQQRSFANAIEKQRIGFDHTDEKDAKKQTENNQWIGGYIDNVVDKSKNYPLIDGARTIPLDPLGSKVFTKGKDVPTAIQISDDGKTFTPIYPIKDANDNPTSEVNPSLSQPMDKEAVKLNLGYKTLTKKDLGGAMKNVYNTQVQIQVGNKKYHVPKSSLEKLDKDKVSYKLIQ